jgi:hypothetical protein
VVLLNPEAMEIEEGPSARLDPLLDWRISYLDCLVRETLPVDKIEARRLTHHAKSFIVIGEELYKKSRTGVLQRCIPTEQGNELLDDIHCGSCGHHVVPRTLVSKAFQQGFY